MKEREAGGIDPALFRGLTQPRLSRRRMLKGVAGAALGISAAGLLSACGLPGTRDTGWKDGYDWKSWWADQTVHKQLNWANWPLYIDTAKGRHPSIDKFTKQTGISVDYSAVIQDNASFFSTISPVLQAGESTGYDLMVFSNGWQLTQLMQNNWLIPLDHSRLPNFRKYAGEVATDLKYDPDLTYNAVWQAGLTAIAYDPNLTDGEIDSVEALFDPKWKGRVGMLTDDDELGTVALLALGIEPLTSTYKDWEKAAKLLTKQRDKGIVRQYYDNSYIKALENGDVVVTQAYSGDIFQANNSGSPQLRFVVPKQGGVIWRDNCVVPYHAENPVDAMAWIDFYFKPENQAIIEDWVNYMSPVPAAQPIIRNQLEDPTVADSPLVFPTAADFKTFVEYPITDTIERRQKWQSLFDPIIQS